MEKASKIYVAGHRGLVGSAIVRKLSNEGYKDLVCRSHAELDLTRQDAVEQFFESERPAYVFLAAAKVGGIWANNTYPAEFIYDNLAIETNMIHSSFLCGVKRLLFLGSSCIYPKHCPQPMKEEYLLSGYLEPTNEPYAIAKIAGAKMCQFYNRQYGTRFLTVMPTNLYGPNDNFDLENSHVLPALIRKFHLAKLASQGDWGAICRDEKLFGLIPQDFRATLTAISQSPGHPLKPDVQSPPAPVHFPAVTLWGTGSPSRELLHVDDLADACLFIMSLDDETFWELIHGDNRDQRSDDLPSPSDFNEADSEGKLSSVKSLPLINIGCGKDLTIRELANLVSRLVGYEGEVLWDTAKPDGTPRKLLDISRLKSLGWSPRIDLETGIRNTYNWYLEQGSQVNFCCGLE